MNYYNEHDPKAAAWLRELIACGHIPAGVVDERDIQQVKHDELTNYTQCHFFAGIGGWPLALRLAGWPDTLPVWTGSCPCQPFSAAGQRKGESDERHVWPDFRRLIEGGKPPVAFGEQVASKAGREWLAGIRTDLEELAYEVGAADLCAAGVNAPHIRQRIYWVADANGRNPRSEGIQCGGEYGLQPQGGISRGLADNQGERRNGSARMQGQNWRAESETSGRMGNSDEQGCARQSLGLLGAGHQGNWSDYDLLECTDGKTRRTEPGAFPLADGIPGRMGLLRGYGNAIVPQLAAEFVMAWRDIYFPNAGDNGRNAARGADGRFRSKK